MTDPREYKCPKDVVKKVFEAVITKACVSELLSDEDFALIQHFCSESSVSLADFVEASLLFMATTLAYPGTRPHALAYLYRHRSDEEAQNESL